MKLHWGNGIVIFFIVFLTLCGIFIAFALRQNNDLVTRDYYEQGANYSDQMAVKKRSVLFQDSIKVNSSASALNFEFAPSIVNASDSIELYFYKSSDQTKDLIIKEPLTTTKKTYSIQAFEPGRYKLRIRWTVEEETFQIDQILDI